MGVVNNIMAFYITPWSCYTIYGGVIMVKNLKALRNKKGISQQQLADSIGVSQQSINKYENHNIEPDIKTLINMADYFSTSVDYLIGRADTKRKTEITRKYELGMDESVIVDGYRFLSDNEKHSIRLVIDNYNKKNKTASN
jgi:transcriptional regulator with XRE-family HTH domain